MFKLMSNYNFMPKNAYLGIWCIYRFHKVAWGCYESSSESPSGVIVCGADNGGLLSYNADKFIKGEAECLLFKNNKHTGAVKALDFNPFQVGIYGRHMF